MNFAHEQIMTGPNRAKPPSRQNRKPAANNLPTVSTDNDCETPPTSPVDRIAKILETGGVGKEKVKSQSQLRDELAERFKNRKKMSIVEQEPKTETSRLAETEAIETDIKPSTTTTNVPFNGETYRILSIDGGGVRALLPALVLAELETRCQKPCARMFDMICGTSTGAIVAAMLSVRAATNDSINPKYTAQDVVNLFTTESSQIFAKRALNRTYSNVQLKSSLERLFGDARMNQCLGNLVVSAATDDKIAQTHVFDSKLKASENLRIVDVLMASLAAPGFFEPYTIAELSK